MKFETIRSVIKFRLLAAAMLAAGLCASAGHAQSFSGKFTLPHEVRWGTNVLPAGQYSIRMDGVAATAIVRSTDGKIAFRTPIPIKDHSQKGATVLYVLARGNKRMVLSLNLPEYGVSLVYRPTTSAEREMIAKADHASAVPLTAATK